MLEAFSDKSRGYYFYEGVDSVRGKFEEFVSMPSEGEVRYHRHGRYAGRAVRLVQAVPNSGGIWTCVLPSFTLTTIKLGARSAVTTRPTGGVTYQGAPTLDAAAKTRARERSAQMIQAGIVAAELDAYKPMSGRRARVEKVCRVFFALLTAIMLFFTWGTQSFKHAVLGFLVMGATWKIGSYTGAGERAQQLLDASEGWWIWCRERVDASMQQYEYLYSMLHDGRVSH